MKYNNNMDINSASILDVVVKLIWRSDAGPKIGRFVSGAETLIFWAVQPYQVKKEKRKS
jgi:hypothetical protein